MLRLLLSRCAASLIALIGASLFCFVVLHIAPGDPARLFLGPFATAAAVAELHAKLGLDQPLAAQYVTYLVDFVSGDWGFSYTTGETVAQELAERLPATLEIGMCAFFGAVAGAVTLALAAAYRRGTTTDAAALGFSFFSLGVPPFWLGLMLLVTFFEQLGWLPGPDGRLSLGVEPPPWITGFYTIDALLSAQFATFLDAAGHIVLPALALALPPFGFLFRLLRANLIETEREPYILVARSRGVGRWAAFVRHSLPNAVLPTLTAAGLLFGQLLAGSVLVERVFNWPGVGGLVTEGVLRQDFSVVQAFILLSAVSYVLTNLAVDVLAGLIDPRVRHPAHLQ